MSAAAVTSESASCSGARYAAVPSTVPACVSCVAPADEVRRRLALDVLHHEERPAVVLADVEDTHDVRVREPGGEARLAEEAAADAVVTDEVVAEQLDGDDAVQLDVLGALDDGHAAVPNRAEQPVTTPEQRRRAQPSSSSPCFFGLWSWCFFSCPFPCSGGFAAGCGAGCGAGAGAGGEHGGISATTAFTPLESGSCSARGTRAIDAVASVRNSSARRAAPQFAPRASADATASLSVASRWASVRGS